MKMMYHKNIQLCLQLKGAQAEYGCHRCLLKGTHDMAVARMTWVGVWRWLAADSEVKAQWFSDPKFKHTGTSS